MKAEEFAKINNIEENHWWYVGTREICLSILERFLPKTNGTLADDLTIFDVGCGTGGNMKYLARYGNVEGSDIDAYAIKLAGEKGYKCKVGDMKNLGLDKDKYDLITLFDVLSQAHENEIPQVLSGINNGLRTGGILAMREPAFSFAAGKHDEDIGMKVRFTTQSMQKTLEIAGHEVLYVGYINFFLFWPAVLKRKLDYVLRKPAQSDVVEHSSLVNTLFLAILRLEKFLLRFVKFPFGLSVFVVSRKRGVL
jgi:SAM-dependent methyltransferase